MELLIRTDWPQFANDMADVVRIFLGAVPWKTAPLPGAGEDAGIPEETLVLTHTEAPEAGGARLTVRAEGAYAGREEQSWPRGGDALSEKRLHKRAVKLAVYALMKKATGVRPPWGSLTGIRPTRLVYAAMAEGMALEEAAVHVREVFDVSEEKTALLTEIIRRQQTLPQPSGRETELYVGIPFCVSRCAYCSFLSGELGDGKLVVPYVDALLREIDFVKRLLSETGLSVSSVYVGGGTPTALPEDQLERVLSALAPLARGHEFTVEAGRPDTITRGKLQVIQSAGAARFSVNPQTMHDVTLQRIGRAHTARQTVEAYHLAREMGFRDINMDLIAGLPGEDGAMFDETLRQITDLGPDSLTVHTLSIKHASVLHLFGAPLPDGGMAAAMQRRGMEEAHRMGMKAYYLYRQKYMAGALENVAYAKPGLECLYNVRMMEETGHVLALGAGGISKRIWPAGGKITRAPNVGNIEEYIARVDEMCERKRALWEAPGEGAGP